jgi:predicted enzyme related to lactoylglutathione lyase
MMQRAPDTPSPVLVIDVDSVDDALTRVEQAGGTVVRPKVEMPGMGAYAYFKDTEGNVLGVFESARG